MTVMAVNQYRQAAARLHSIPRMSCGFYPTPLEDLSRLREALGGGPRLLIKRDDYTGVGCGGNKVRKLEYALARAAADGAEVVITMGGEKSNHARMTAAMCARLGLGCVLVLNLAAAGSVPPGFKPASLFIDEAFGAEIHLVGGREERKATAERIAAELRREGKRVTTIPLGASDPLGALGFARAVEEAAAQLNALGARPTHIFHASSSGGTQAGLLAGCRLFGFEDVSVIGVSADDSSASIGSEIAGMVKGVYELLDVPAPERPGDRITVLDDYVGPGYGLSAPESAAASSLLARAEGVLLDPVYTAKAMAALIDWIEKGRLTERDTALFWHTGGQMAMFFTPA